MNRRHRQVSKQLLGMCVHSQILQARVECTRQDRSLRDFDQRWDDDANDEGDDDQNSKRSAAEPNFHCFMVSPQLLNGFLDTHTVSFRLCLYPARPRR